MAEKQAIEEVASLDGSEKRNTLQSIEHYFPAGFPELLFQGTSTSNSDTVREIGLRGGSLVTNLNGCMDTRFYRGRFLVTRYDQNIFEPQVETHVQYMIRDGTASEEEKRRKFTFDAMDTDSVMVRAEITSGRLNQRENIASFNLSSDQRIYLQLIAILLGGGLCGVTDPKLVESVESMGFKTEWNQTDTPFPDSGDFMSLSGGSIDEGEGMYLAYSNNYPRRVAMANFLGVDISAFVNKVSLKEVLDNIGEEEVINRLMTNFPGAIDIDWNNLQIEGHELLKKIIEQIYKTHIVRSVKSIYEKSDGNIPTLAFMSGGSATGLEELMIVKAVKAEQFPS